MVEPALPFRRRLRALLWAHCARLLACFPPQVSAALLVPFAYGIARTRIGQQTSAQLQITLGATHSKAELTRLQRRVFRHTARQAAEAAFLAHAKPARLRAWIDRNVVIDPSIQILRSALEQGAGAIVLTAHLGNWEVLAAALAQAGFEGTVVGRYRKRDPSAAWLVQMRRNYGVETHPQDAPPRELLAGLRNNQILGLLCDLEVRRLAGEFLPFLGRPALTMSAPAALARASGAPLVPVRCIRTGHNPKRYHLSVEAPIPYARELAPKVARSTCLLAMNEVYDRWIRETPEQWAWYQARWKTAPGEHDVRPLAGRPKRPQSSRGTA